MSVSWGGRGEHTIFAQERVTISCCRSHPSRARTGTSGIRVSTSLPCGLSYWTSRYPWDLYSPASDWGAVQDEGLGGSFSLMSIFPHQSLNPSLFDHTLTYVQTHTFFCGVGNMVNVVQTNKWAASNKAVQTRLSRVASLD